ncbi:hypothetical protein FOL47_001348 [Perkinsus chesapeaki]|uniref:Stress-induced-phosphoprotein 1 n=1 Tax=Perkinsus chesapeaki TaxID=330153 RepID=A0A7J6MJA2_PERCH|nr:hypothetical protein FOL47_001348 [Perkinsus chesapeaki]
MFTPEMMQAAQNMMANMTPEQMAQMTEMAKNMDPNMMRNMMGGQGMPPGGISRDQIDQATEQMRNMTPEQMRDAMGQAQSQQANQMQYYVNATNTLKAEGNALVKEQKYNEALEKYARGIENVKSYSTPSVLTLQKALYSNAALCCLKLEKFQECRDYCDHVLEQDPKAVKALYRRGIAYRELEETDKAYLDLSAAARLSPNDEVLVNDFMEFKSSLPEDYIVPSEESISDEETVGDKASPSNGSGSASTTPGSSTAGSIDPSLQREMSAKLASDPEMVKKMQDMMKDMSPEEVSFMMSGSAPGESAAARKFAERLRNEDPAFVQKMKDMVDSLPQDQVDQIRKAAAGGSASSASASTAGRPGMPPTGAAGLAEASRMMKENPDVMNQMSDMMAGMSDDQFESMLRMSGMSASAQDTAAMREMMRNKDMMKAMGDMMKNMSPDQLNAMSEAAKPAKASSSASSSSANPAGEEEAPADMPKMPEHPGDMFKDPKMLKSMEAMINSMPDDVLENLIAQQAGSQAGPDGAPSSLPKWVTGRRIKFFLRIIMKLARLVIFIRNLFAAMFSRRGKYIMALLVLLFAIYQQYFSGSGKVEDAPADPSA